MLSDELIEIGRKANPKNNLSCAEVLKKMVERAQKDTGKVPGKQIDNSMRFAIRQLVKEGYVYYGRMAEQVERSLTLCNGCVRDMPNLRVNDGIINQQFATGTEMKAFAAKCPVGSCKHDIK